MKTWHEKPSPQSIARYPGSAASHNRLVGDALLYIGRNAHQVASVWPQETGVAYREDPETGRRNYIAYGVKGGGDISGIMLGGRRLECEAKSGSSTQQPNQKRFESMILRRGGLYIVFRTPEGLLDLLLRAAASSS